MTFFENPDHAPYAMALYFTFVSLVFLAMHYMLREDDDGMF